MNQREAPIQPKRVGPAAGEAPADGRGSLAYLAALTLGLHYMWELGQARLYRNFEGVSFMRHAFRCSWSSLGDVLIAAIGYLVAALLTRDLWWALKGTWPGTATAAWLATGEAITIGVERWALDSGAWVYGPSMPTVLGIGLSPLLQWLLVPAATLLLFRRARYLRLRREI